MLVKTLLGPEVCPQASKCLETQVPREVPACCIRRDNGTSPSSLISVPLLSLCASYLPVYAEVQEPHVYLQNSRVELSNLYLGVPTRASVTLINGTQLPTHFHWGKVSSVATPLSKGHAPYKGPPEHTGSAHPSPTPACPRLMARCSLNFPQPAMLVTHGYSQWEPGGDAGGGAHAWEALGPYSRQ